MPRYDFRCESGHVAEQVADRDIRSLLCSCGAVAHRELAVGIGLNNLPTPTRYRDTNMKRFDEAHGEMLWAHEKAGVEPPDVWSIAKDRVAVGDVRSIGEETV